MFFSISTPGQFPAMADRHGPRWPREPLGRSAAEDRSVGLFWSEASARSRAQGTVRDRARRGKKAEAMVSLGDGEAHRSPPRAGNCHSATLEKCLRAVFRARMYGA